MAGCICCIGSVDDHFAKSLGSTWTRIKKTLNTQQPHDSVTVERMSSSDQTPDRPVQISSMSASEAPRSVDDHFAKALGEAWFRIKAEQQIKAEREGLAAEAAGLDEAS